MRVVTAVEYLDGYRLRVTFSDGSIRDVDLEGQLDGPIFDPLHDISYFMSARVDDDVETVVWDNGADIAPEYLYDNGVEVTDVA